MTWSYSSSGTSSPARSGTSQPLRHRRQSVQSLTAAIVARATSNTRCGSADAEYTASLSAAAGPATAGTARRGLAGAHGAAAALLLLAACSSDDGAGPAETGGAPTTTAVSITTATAPTVETVECDGVVPDGPDVECGVLTVEDGTVTIPYAVLRSPNPEPLPDPIIYFSGGPGDDGRDIAEFLLQLGIAGGERDVIVFDQRGTGASTPSLDCPEYTEAVWQQLGAPLPPAEELAIARDAYGACRERLVGEGVDLDAYDTPTTAADVETLRQALGIDEWNLFGLSYGTTVALEVVRQNPEAVRSAVFDSVYPPDQPSDGAAYVAQAQRALGALAAGCAADPACAAAHGDISAGLQALFDAWNADPYEATVEDPATGQQRQLVLTGHDVIAGLWNAMYDETLLVLLPSLPAQLAARDPIADVVVQEFATSGVDQLTAGAEALGAAVNCADRQQLNGAAAEEVTADEPFYAGLVAFAEQPCDLWDVEPVDSSFNDPVASDIPSLFLGNEYDPVTPPGDTEATAARFPNGTYVEFPGLGHGAVFAHECPRSLFAAFIADPTAPVDTACVATMGAPEWTV